MECILKFRGTVEGCELYDRVIGLAAARLVIHSGMISSIETPVVSEPALEELSKTDIKIRYDERVKNILKDDG